MSISRKGNIAALIALGIFIRVGINYGNFLLVTSRLRSRAALPPISGGSSAGDWACPSSSSASTRAGKLADGVQTGAWDVAFLGAEPQRAAEIAFTAAYLEIPSTYLVPAGSPIRSIDEVDREGVRIAVAEKSAYELYLSRTLKHAKLVGTKGLDASYDLFVAEKLEALAGLKPRLLTDVQKLPGSRVLDGQFTASPAGHRHAEGPRRRGAVPARIRRGREGLGPGGPGHRAKRRRGRLGGAARARSVGDLRAGRRRAGHPPPLSVRLRWNAARGFACRARPLCPGSFASRRTISLLLASQRQDSPCDAAGDNPLSSPRV